MADAAPTGDDVGQKLGDWLNFRQAIALHGVLHPEPASPLPAARMQKAVAVAPEALTRHVQKLRAQLEESIILGAPPGSGLSRIEMQLVALRNTEFAAAGQVFALAAGEHIHTENSHKWTIPEARLMALASGWMPANVWTDVDVRFSLHLWQRDPGGLQP
jgi:hypothetical protein